MTTEKDPMLELKQAERFLIGAWLSQEQREHLKLFEEADFSELRHLFREIKRGRTDNLDISEAAGVSVQEQMAIIEDYTKTPARDVFFKSFAKRIIKAGLQREMANGIEGAEKYLQKWTTLNLLEGVIEEAGETLLSEYLNELARRTQQKPIQYDMPRLNTLLGGLKKAELTTIAARPGTGKSAFALQTAEAAARAGHKVLFFNLEMTQWQIYDRLIIRHTDVPAQALQSGEAFNNELQAGAILNAITTFEKIQENLTFKIKNSNVDYFRSIISEEKPDLVIVDQLSHLTCSLTFPDIRQRYNYIVESLKRLASSFDIPILLLAQLNRNAEEKEPTLADLKESGVIEETSDNVVFLFVDPEHKDSVEEVMQLPCVLKVAKNRQGEQGRTPVIFRKNKCYFVEREIRQGQQTSRKTKTY